MSKRPRFTLLALVLTLTACSTTKRESSIKSAIETTRTVGRTDSLTISRLKTMICDRPVIKIVRRNSTDTTVVTLCAEKVTFSDIFDSTAMSRTADSVSVVSSRSESAVAERKRQRSLMPLWLMVLSGVTLIVLSWREIRSRR